MDSTYHPVTTISDFFYGSLLLIISRTKYRYDSEKNKREEFLSGLTIEGSWGKGRKLTPSIIASPPPKMPKNEAVGIQRILHPDESLYALPVREVNQLPISTNNEQAPRAFEIGMIPNLSNINRVCDASLSAHKVRLSPCQPKWRFCSQSF